MLFGYFFFTFLDFQYFISKNITLKLPKINFKNHRNICYHLSKHLRSKNSLTKIIKKNSLCLIHAVK